MPTRSFSRRPSFCADLVDALAQRRELRRVGARRDRGVDAGRRAVLAEHGAQRVGPLAGRDARVRAAHRRLHQVRARPRARRAAPRSAALDLGRRCASRGARAAARSARGPPSRRPTGSTPRPAASGDGSPSVEAVHADDGALARLDLGHAARVRLDELPLHVARLDRGDRAALLLDARDLRPGRGLDLGGLLLDHHRALEDVAVLEHVGLVGEDLLDAQRPLLVPRARQAERLVPGGELQRAAARVARQRHAERLERDARHVVLGLRLGEPERVHLHAVAEAAHASSSVDAVALEPDLVPHARERAHLADLLDEADAGVAEERDAAEHRAELARAARAPSRAPPSRSRARTRPPAPASRRPPAGDSEQTLIGFHFGTCSTVHSIIWRVRSSDGRGGKMYVPRDRYSFTMSFCVVPCSSPRGDAVALRDRDVQREQPRRRRVDRHRRVHLVERDALEQRVHVGDRARSARRPCRPRRRRAGGRRRSRSAWAGRTRSTAPSAPWRGSAGTARSTRARSSAPSRCGRSRDDRPSRSGS